MRTSKVFSITMPPDLAKQAEALAKKENRTMSELMREALRRYRQPMLLDLREYIRRMAPTPPAYQAIRAEARRKGMDKLTMAQIDREVAAARRRQPANKTKHSTK
jgi:Arc/MetJ-type ribon-helix-helix transcriptional regulator